jgi:hypothetical protein
VRSVSASVTENASLEPAQSSAGESLSGRTITGGQWRMASLVVQGVLHLVIGVVLARLLPRSRSS